MEGGRPAGASGGGEAAPSSFLPAGLGGAAHPMSCEERGGARNSGGRAAGCGCAPGNPVAVMRSILMVQCAKCAFGIPCCLSLFLKNVGYGEGIVQIMAEI